MQQVVSSLKAIISPNSNNKIHSNIYVDDKKESEDVILFSTVNVDIGTLDFSISDLIEDYDLESVGNECNPDILFQAEELFRELFDLKDTIDILVDKLITLLIKTQDEGNTLNESKHFINQCITLSNRIQSDIFNWLTENRTKPQYVFFLGFFYFQGIEIEKNHDEAFQ